MTINDLFLLALLFILAYILWSHANMSTIAIQAARKRCEQEGVQLLDQNVILKRLSIRPSPYSLLAIKRQYVFEFSSVGDKRYQGHIYLLGKRVDSIELAPFKVQ